MRADKQYKNKIHSLVQKRGGGQKYKQFNLYEKLTKAKSNFNSNQIFSKLWLNIYIYIYIFIYYISWMLEIVLKHKSLFRPPIKILRLDYFYSNLSKCGTRVNEAQ